jgi:hypothetical protein
VKIGVVAREEIQYYFKCSSCRWYGPLTKDELASIRVRELGSSSCPRCGQIGFLSPNKPARTTPTLWLAVGALVAIVAIALLAV